MIASRKLALVCVAILAAVGENVPAAESEGSSTESGAATAVAPNARIPERTLEGGTIARPVEPFVPKYPAVARRKAQEGWVILSFVVQTDGTVAEPVVEDSSGEPSFEKVALDAISKTRYQPATLNGKPIQQCAAQFQYIFQIDKPGQGARSSFIKAYTEINRLADAQHVAEAETKLLELQRQGLQWNYEAARLWLLHATLQMKKGDAQGALRSLDRGTFSRGQFLEPKVYRQALVEKFRLQVQSGAYGSAMTTYKQMQALKPPFHHDGVDRAVADIERRIKAPQPLSFPGVVEFRSGCEEGRPNWKHELIRRKFAFDDIEGRIDDFQLRCDWKLIKDKVSTDKAWEVPASWGYCQIFVFGEVGARIKLVEYPLAVTQPD